MVLFAPSVQIHPRMFFSYCVKARATLGSRTSWFVIRALSLTLAAILIIYIGLELVLTHTKVEVQYLSVLVLIGICDNWLLGSRISITILVIAFVQSYDWQLGCIQTDRLIPVSGLEQEESKTRTFWPSSLGPPVSPLSIHHAVEIFAEKPSITAPAHPYATDAVVYTSRFSWLSRLEHRVLIHPNCPNSP